MHQTIRERYNDTILAEAMRRYAIAPEDINLLDGFESFIFRFVRDGEKFVLRIGHTMRNSEAFVRGEVDWINYLVENGVSAAGAVPSADGNLVERIDDGQGGAFLATSFRWASGEKPWRRELDDTLCENYGRLIGRMHALARTYVPRDPLGERPLWNHPRISDAERNLPASQAAAAQRYRDCVARQTALPSGSDAFGLIHSDAHMSNFFVDDDGRLTLFDFDDCHYSWFANDIAMVLFYIVTNEADPVAKANNFFPPFLRGYARENRLDPAWLDTIPLFLKSREIELYGVAYRSFEDVDDIDNDWLRTFMKDRRWRIEAGIPYVDVDFATFAPLLLGD